jgi:hypothetical protein
MITTFIAHAHSSKLVWSSSQADSVAGAHRQSHHSEVVSPPLTHYPTLTHPLHYPLPHKKKCEPDLNIFSQNITMTKGPKNIYHVQNQKKKFNL